jgi:glutaredoxin
MTPTLYHDGCNVCLDIARALQATMPGLALVDLALDPDAAFDAMALGVRDLPCLVVDGRVLPVAPHSVIDDVAAAHG